MCPNCTHPFYLGKRPRHYPLIALAKTFLFTFYRCLFAILHDSQKHFGYTNERSKMYSFPQLQYNSNQFSDKRTVKP